MSIFDRLVGLETEYAMRFRPDDEKLSSAPSKFTMYQAVIAALRQQVLTVQARHFKEGVFTANGGAVWFEAERPAAGAGLVEGSTPECRGPHQLVAYQRAQDRLLSTAAQHALLHGRLSLLKNDRDGQDNVYGAQENYELQIARGWRLGLWRGGLVALLPLLALTWIGFLLMIGIMLIYLALAGMIYLPLQLLVRQPRRVAMALFGGDLVEGRETGSPLPQWMETSLLWTTRVLTAPLAICLLGLLRLTAFHSTRSRMLAFLISRAVIGGSGMVDRQGRFLLADKAPAVNCVLGFGGFMNDRPIFTMGHFFKAMCVESCLTPGDFVDLLQGPQRLQIALGDSNMSENAELLRVGCTMLVLDAIEAGWLDDAPRLHRPIAALQTICRDVSLQAEVAGRNGRRYTALQLQRYYLQRCRQFVDSQPDAPAAAHDILQRWDDALDGLEQFQASGVIPSALVGNIDWITKQYLIQQVEGSPTWSVLKKIDLRYHELSPEGYFQILQAAGLALPVIDEQQIQRAVRSAPPDSPATARGHYIREFSGSSGPLAVNWKRVVIGRGWGAKIVRLTRYGRRPAARQDSGSLTQENDV